MSEKYEVDYSFNGRAEKLFVTAADFVGAAKAATERLVVLHGLVGTVEIESISRARNALVNEPADNDVTTSSDADALDALERIALDLAEDSSLRSDPEEWSAKALWVAVLCLKDAGRQVSPEVLEAYEEYEDYWFDSYWHVDIGDENRDPLDPYETLDGIGTALHNSWQPLEVRRSQVRWGDREDRNRDVDFTDNKMVHAYITVVDALASAGKLEAKSYLEHGYKEVFPRFLEANPLSGKALAR